MDFGFRCSICGSTDVELTIANTKEYYQFYPDVPLPTIGCFQLIFTAECKRKNCGAWYEWPRVNLPREPFKT